MGKSKEVKTNAMRILERNKIPYKEYTYECDEFVDALKVADTLGQPYELLYKTLVTIGNSRNYFVFVIPIAEELDMKKAAKSVGEKSVSMIHVKDINQVTGYIRGGCTAIGMKKQYVTRIEKEDDRQRRPPRRTDRAETGRSEKGKQGRVCRYYFQTAGISTDNQQGFHSHRIPLPADCRVKQHLR